MNKKFSIALLFIGMAWNASSQVQELPKVHRYVDLAVTVGSSQGSVAGSYVHNWRLGKKSKWEAGLGLRLTSYLGTKRDYITAPARLARGTTVPFVIVFAEQKVENFDTLNVQRPFTNSLNVSANLAYHFNTKWSAGLNIDLIGLTVGRTTSSILVSNGTTRTELKTKPAAFNVLLTGDLDYGSLNSEFFLTYRFNKKWALRGIYQFYFSEYKTTSIKQIAPDGTQVDRFRNKVNAFGLGLSRQL